MFVPNGNRVLVELDEVSGKTEGGLFVPQTAEQDGPKKATVVMAGESYFMNGEKVFSSFFKGDHVLVDTLGATRMRLEGKDLVCVRNEDVVGKYV